MGYCENCETYYKKLPKHELCKTCSNALVGTPPGINNAFKQFEALMMKKRQLRENRQRYLQQATLMDICADVIIKHKDLLLYLEEVLDDGHPPWYYLLRSWYRMNKQRGRSITSERYPKKRLFKLMQLPVIVSVI